MTTPTQQDDLVAELREQNRWLRWLYWLIFVGLVAPLWVGAIVWLVISQSPDF